MSLKENIKLPRTYIDAQNEVDEKITQVINLRSSIENSVKEYNDTEGGQLVDGAYLALFGNLLRKQSDLQFELDQLRRDAVIQYGDEVVVYKGRKVPIGTSGIVAHVHYTGKYLIKDPATWRDRSTSGIWVRGSNLAKVYNET